MFGYVRPYTPELKVRELEMYRAAYCGLCRNLGKRYGFIARCTLGYDFVFLTLLLADQTAPRVSLCRCPLSLRRKRCLDCGEASEVSAAYGVILAYHKLSDDLSDEGFPKGTAALAARTALKRAYRRASADHPAFDGAVRAGLEDLRRTETDASLPLDAPADAFARILAATAPGTGGEPRRRVIETLLYHVGRWIYILDARDDMDGDAKRGRPNAVSARMGDLPPDERDERLRVTLNNSLSVAGSALELLDEGAYGGILRNIIYLGLPEVRDMVFRGEYDARPRVLIHGKRTM